MLAPTQAKPPLEEFEDVRNEMEDFTARFQSIILEKKSDMQVSKQQHINNLKELTQKARRLRAEVENKQIIRGNTKEAINSSLNDFLAKKAKVEALTQQLNTLRQTKDSLQANIDSEKADLNTSEQSLLYAHTNLESQTQKDNQELTKYEMYLGLKVEAVEEDLLKFRFVNVDATDIDKEVSFDLYVGGDVYSVSSTNPTLPAEQISSMEDNLNRHDEIVVFLKSMRKALKNA